MANDVSRSDRQGEALGLIPAAPMPPTPFTMHKYFQLIYVRRGSVPITIGDVSTVLHEGDLALTVPFLFHRNDPAPDAMVMELRIASYLCNEATRVFEHKRPIRPYLRKEELPPLIPSLLKTLSQRVRELSATPAELMEYRFSQRQCVTLLPYLAVLLLEISQSMPLAETDHADISVTEKILTYCNVNYGLEISRDMVARDCNVSLAMVSQTFTQMGISFRDYINALRINRAYAMLTTTKKPITEIIYECGYSNQGTFNRNFQLQFGKSPRDIRQGR